MAQHRQSESNQNIWDSILGWLWFMIPLMWVRIKMVDWMEFIATIIVFLLFTLPVWSLGIFFYFFLQR